MDTDDLSREAYDAIIVEAEKFNNDLALPFELLSYDCQDEEEYLNESTKLLGEMKKLDKHHLDDIFFGNPPELSKLHDTIDRIHNNIKKVSEIPFEKRTFDF